MSAKRDIEVTLAVAGDLRKLENLQHQIKKIDYTFRQLVVSGWDRTHEINSIKKYPKLSKLVTKGLVPSAIIQKIYSALNRKGIGVDIIEEDLVKSVAFACKSSKNVYINLIPHQESNITCIRGNRLIFPDINKLINYNIQNGFPKDNSPSSGLLPMLFHNYLLALQTKKSLALLKIRSDCILDEKINDFITAKEDKILFFTNENKLKFDLANNKVPDQAFLAPPNLIYILEDMWVNFEKLYNEFALSTDGPWGGERFFYWYLKKFNIPYEMVYGYNGLVR